MPGSRTLPRRLLAYLSSWVIRNDPGQHSKTGVRIGDRSPSTGAGLSNRGRYASDETRHLVSARFSRWPRDED